MTVAIIILLALGLLICAFLFVWACTLLCEGWRQFPSSDLAPLLVIGCLAGAAAALLTSCSSARKYPPEDPASLFEGRIADEIHRAWSDSP